ncbi:transmembrane 9 superfamily member 4-like [Sycon ciliatum]|uniref:transmembrane 9 superfamily member 4-like n=1 Tax=Sycon ciliatum TaxID=27933 RepID=UPI0020AE1325|eukprot:scpid41850/ scgid17266/ Transmembrane 9 superfamily member 4
MMRRIFEVLLLVGIALGGVNGFYIPGVQLSEYASEQEINVKAVKMTSVKTQIPYEYYSLPFCKPEIVHYRSENLGEVLRGDRISNTLYTLSTLKAVKCQTLCPEMTISAADSTKLAQRIQQDYSVHMLVDNLPAATKYVRVDKPNVAQYEHGYKLGIPGKVPIINNHLALIIRYHASTSDVGKRYRIVGFEVQPLSVGNGQLSIEKTQCTFKTTNIKEIKPQPVVAGKENKIVYSYSVMWAPSTLEWASRWDTYLELKDGQVHWFSIINSLTIVLFLSGIVAIILVRTLRRDIARYNKLDEEDIDDAIEETGWKLVHGDIFRPPVNIKILSAFISTGVQLLAMFVITLVLALMGMLSPASRGALMSAAIFLFAFMGMFGGYMAGRLYRTLKGDNWKDTGVLCAVLYPGMVGACCFLVNLFLWAKQSSAALPFTTMLALLAVWLCISMPLVVGGFFFGFRKQPYDHPVRTNQIPRQVPEQVWYMGREVSVLLAGILPFCAVFIELFFILTAIWENRFYYMFGFLFLVFLILVIVCSEITIVIVYFMLCGENYHWWWRSWMLSSSSSLYVFLYSVFYFSSKLSIAGFVPTLLYFTYSILMCSTYGLLTGSIGFYATYWFVSSIYGAVKID